MIFCALPAMSPTMTLSCAVQIVSAMKALPDKANDYVTHLCATARAHAAGTAMGRKSNGGAAVRDPAWPRDTPPMRRTLAAPGGRWQAATADRLWPWLKA